MPAPRSTPQQSATPASTPARPSLQQAVQAYQAKTPYSEKAFADMFPYLQKLGYKVARGTHAANTLASADAVVDAESGKVYDVVLGTKGEAPTWGYLDQGVYDPSRKVVGPTGELIPYTDWAGQAATPGAGEEAPAAPATDGRPDPTDKTSIFYGSRLAYVMKPKPKPGTATPVTGGPVNTTNLGNSTPAGAAALAASMQRKKANRGGRASTILGGFGSGAPTTRRATLLGGGGL